MSDDGRGQFLAILFSFAFGNEAIEIIREVLRIASKLQSGIDITR